MNDILCVIKIKDDEPMPKKKTELFILFQQLKHRSVELLNNEAAICGTDDAGTLDIIHKWNIQNNH